MEIIIIALAAAFASLLTFFSGFGLGTLLMPVFALFFPVELAIAMTGVVHLANNLFKWGLVHKHINWKVALRFGLPAMAAAFFGAKLLLNLEQLAPWHHWQWGEKTFYITPLKCIIGVLLLIFALLELSPRFARWQVSENKMVAGGLLSGFFGGLSGHQGALRSAFLIKAGLSKEAFIATGVIIACMIDISRLSVYASRFGGLDADRHGGLMAVAIAAAFVGAVAGSRMLKKVTMKQVQWLVSVLLVTVALGLILGII
jgi:uncharacterized protein